MSHVIKLLTSYHDKAEFSCGKDILDNYIRHQARQDMKKKVAVCFVFADDKKQIKGYYTLSSGSIPRSLLPEMISKSLPKYEDLPVTMLGRLAVDKGFQGKGIGSLLFFDALNRCYETSSKSVDSKAVIVDPIDHEVTNFYAKYGFILLPNRKRLFLPMSTIAQLFH